MRIPLLSVALGLLACTCLGQIPASSVTSPPSVVRARLLVTSIFALRDSADSKAKWDSSIVLVDSLIAVLPTIQSDSLMRFASMGITYTAHDIGDPLRGKRLLTDAFRQARLLGDPLLESRYVMEASVTVSSDTNFTTLILSFVAQLAADLEKSLPRHSVANQCRAIQFLSEIGNQYLQSITPDACVRIESLAMQLTQRLHLPYALPWCTLAVLYYKQGKTQEALSLALDGVRISETPNGPYNGFGYEYAAYLYFAMGEYDKAFNFFDKCIPLLKKDPTLIYVPGGLFAYAIRAYLKLQRPAEALRLLKMIGQLKIPLDDTDKPTMEVATADTWYALGKKDSAEKYYRGTLRYYRNNPFYQNQRLGNIANFYVGTRQFVRAKPLLEMLTADSNRPTISLTDQEDNWLLRYRVDSAQGNFRQVMHDLLKYRYYHDSLVNDNKNKQLAEVSAKFETENKNKAIADLQQQAALQAQLQRSSIRQDRIVRNGLITGAVLLAVFAAILYTRWQTRRRMSFRLEKLSRHQQKLIGEKEWLLREIHHRVKNNLQIIISLLNIQASQLKDEIAISAFQEIGTRINAISLVHKKLYQETQDMAAIDMRDYIAELVSFLREGLAAPQPIQFALDVQEIVLDPAQCVPVGLILNEGITNAIKYAFPGNPAPSPIIRIVLKEDPENYLTLIIRDNGIGLPAGFDPKKSRSLGLQLIQTLTEQLDGTVDINNENGLFITIRFPWIEPMAAVNSSYAARSTTPNPVWQ